MSENNFPILLPNPCFIMILMKGEYNGKIK